MRRLSIKARIILWFGSILVLLATVGVAYLLTFLGQISERQLKDNLRDVVSDAVKEVRFRYGELQDEEVDFYNKGVSVFVYDTQGRLLGPKVNRGIRIDAVLEDDTVKRVDSFGEHWLVYDQYASGDEGGYWVRGVITLSGTTETLKGLIFLAIIAIPAMLAVTVLGGLFIARKAFEPVGEIARAADAISSGDDLSLRIPDGGEGDELSKIADTINAMLSRLQKSFEQQKQFTSDVSHELRTPTAIIISQCEYVLADADGKEQRKGMEAVLEQAKRMSSIISQLLLLVRAENGKFQPEKETLDIGELCEMVTLELGEKADSRGIRIELEREPGLKICADETLMIRLLTNVISNAISYNCDNGSIFITLLEENGQCLIRVRDTGLGISQEDLSNIFNRFYRGDASRSGEGTGLGLAMAGWIVQLHGGTIEAESELGQGSTFSIRIPIL